MQHGINTMFTGGKFQIQKILKFLIRVNKILVLFLFIGLLLWIMEAQKEELAEVEQNISQNLTLEDGIHIFVRRSLLQGSSDSEVDPDVQTPSISSFSSTEADTTVIVKYKKYLHWTNTGGTGKSEFYSDSFTDSSSTLGTF